MKTVKLSEQLAPLVEQMSRDMAVPVEGLVNQAIFNWARLHGYVEPGKPGGDAPLTHLGQADALPELRMKQGDRAAVPGPVHTAEPVTARVPVVEDPAVAASASSGLDWKQTGGGGSFDVADMTAPSIPRLRQVVLIVGEREVVVSTARFVIGRDPGCDLTIDAPRISRHHAALVYVPASDTVQLEDLNSSNGTWVNGERVTAHELHDGDEFFLGDVSVRVELR